MKDGPCLKQFKTRNGKDYKRLAAYLYGIFKSSYPKSYIRTYKKTLYYYTIKYPKLWKTVPRLRNGLK